jgi:predicted RNA polymerase sigma factor
MNPSPFVKLNRIVVFSKIHGAEAGLGELAATNTPATKKHPLFYTIRADLRAAAGLKAEAAEDLRRAADLAENAVERQFLESKMSTL